VQIEAAFAPEPRAASAAVVSAFVTNHHTRSPKNIKSGRRRRTSLRAAPWVDTDKIEARFDKGVLTVTLPKTPEARKVEKKIEVKPA